MKDTTARSRILQAAKDLFLKFGFSRVTMDELARSLNMSKKTLYKYFPSKEEMLKELTKLEMGQVESNTRSMYRDPNLPVVEKIKRVVAFISAQYGQMNVALIDDLKKHSPQIWKIIETKRRLIIEKEFSAMVEQGKKEGSFRKDVDSKLFLLMYSKISEAILNPEILSQIPFSPSEAYEGCVRILFEGMLTESAKSKYQSHANSA